MSLQRQPKAKPQWAPSSTHIHVHIVRSLLRIYGTIFTVSMTPAEARHTARTLFDLAAAVTADMDASPWKPAGVSSCD